MVADKSIKKPSEMRIFFHPRIIAKVLNFTKFEQTSGLTGVTVSYISIIEGSHLYFILIKYNHFIAIEGYERTPRLDEINPNCHMHASYASDA